MQRQYVETFTALPVVVTSTDLQNGQAFGATMASVPWVDMRITSARWLCGDDSSVAFARQEIPVALRADQECRAGPVGRRARLRAADDDQVWYRRDRGRREEDGLRCRAVILASPGAGGVTSAQEEAGAIGPTSDSERICKVFTEHRNLLRGNQRIAQHGSVPQTGGHCGRCRAMARRSRASGKARR